MKTHERSQETRKRSKSMQTRLKLAFLVVIVGAAAV